MGFNSVCESDVIRFELFTISSRVTPLTPLEVASAALVMGVSRVRQSWNSFITKRQCDAS